MNRVDVDNALRAAEEIFRILVKALQKRFGQQPGLAATRRKNMIEDTAMNDGLEPTLERFDQAMLALHLSRQSKTPTERVEQTTKAHNGFTAVLVDLEALSATDPIMGLTDV